jgi:hypothetical protein
MLKLWLEHGWGGGQLRHGIGLHKTQPAMCCPHFQYNAIFTDSVFLLMCGTVLFTGYTFPLSYSHTQEPRFMGTMARTPCPFRSTLASLKGGIVHFLLSLSNLKGGIVHFLLSLSRTISRWVRALKWYTFYLLCWILTWNCIAKFRHMDLAHFFCWSELGPGFLSTSPPSKSSKLRL